MREGIYTYACVFLVVVGKECQVCDDRVRKIECSTNKACIVVIDSVVGLFFFCFLLFYALSVF